MVAIVFHLATVLVPLAGVDQDVNRLSVMCAVYMVTVLEGTTVLVTMVGVVHVVTKQYVFLLMGA